MNKWIVILICIFCVLVFQATRTSFAQTTITVTGLDKTPDIASYIQSVVVEKHQKSEHFSLLAIRNDVQDAMKAKGFYAAQVDTKEQEKAVTVDVKPGDPYAIGTIVITGYRDKLDHGLHQGEPLLAQAILDSQKAIKKQLLESGCYYTLSVRHEVVLDEDKKTGDVTFILETGPSVTFGDTIFQGAEDLDQPYLQRFIKYNKGECWKPQKLENTKTALLGTGLLSSAQEKLPESVQGDQEVNVVFELKERAPRSVRLGASYYTDEGPGVSASWTHRNFSGSGEELTADMKASLLIQSLGLDYTKPYFLADNQSLLLATAVERQHSDAFEELSLNGSAALKRTFSKFWSGSLDVATEVTEITDKNDADATQTFGLVSVPGILSFDNRDNALDPHSGVFARARVEPFGDAFGEASPFVKSRLTASTYFDLSNSKTDPVLALRASVGSIMGDSTQDIPATKRFYAGGGNSIRGFGYQEAGPFEDGDPAGGRSLVETSAEMRFKVTEDIGVVTFVDAGNVSNSAIPDFDGGLFVGAGAGVRYYTDFGPIRFDVGVPLNKRENLDQTFQIYISIGQAF